MAIFRYKAVAVDGRRLHGEIDAADVPAVVTQLQAAGHLPISAEPKARDWRGDLGGWIRWTGAWRERVKARDVTSMTRELATLLHAGIPLDASLRLLGQHTERAALRAVIEDVHGAVQSGRRLSAALETHTRMFNALYVNLIRSGEASGSLAAALLMRITGRNRMRSERAWYLQLPIPSRSL
jgi:type II secretory pathway component PulF